VTLGDDPSPDQLQRLWDTVVAWRDQNEVTCSESLLQVDSVNESLPDLAESVLDIIGYAEE
jgi:hypothetical protein